MTYYQFRNGTRVSGCTADVAVEELEKIQKKHGVLSPTVVVDEARPATSALHPVFEWDDGIAAEHYRRSQARELIYSVEIIHDDDPPPVKKYTYIKSAESYIETEVVISDVDLYQEALEAFSQRFTEALCKLRQWEALALLHKHPQAALIGGAANTMTQLQRQLEPVCRAS